MILPLLARALLLLGAGVAQEANALAPQHEEAPEAARDQRRLESLFGGALVGVRDHEELGETRGYRELLEALSRYGEQELVQKSVGQFDVASALGNPDRWRGQILRVRAMVVDLGAERLAQPLGDHIDVYRAYLSDPGGSDHMVVDFLGQPPDLEQKEDIVDFEAVFFRIVRWENAKGDLVYAPQLIARNLRKFDQQAAPRRTAFDGLGPKIFLGAALAYIVVRVLLSLRAKKPDPRTSAASRAIRERAGNPRPKPPPL